MPRDFSDFTISECDETISKYGLTDFETYIAQDFPRFNENDRLAVLMQWDAMMQNEVRPSREHASHIQRKRQLDDLHFLLKRAGR